jgi:DNA-binding NtrC family response regulator
VERAVYVSTGAQIMPQNLSIWERKTECAPADTAQPVPDGGEIKDVRLPSLYESERERIENALYAAGFKVKKAAELLGISRRTIYRRISYYGISKEKYLR